MTSAGGLISADKTRGYRPPIQKSNTPTKFNPTGIQANFETYKFDIYGQKIKLGNGHLIINE
ncbi:hypothetical protein RHO15_01005 [Utexia brackfieldae]|uniref:hypothetical protein n=1 Tax=Utexia brackfieldae TaxID=3074108 RepID=UPI00370D0D1B